jgi:LuxR family maltose regulon positive regulatory protein
VAEPLEPSEFRSQPMPEVAGRQPAYRPIPHEIPSPRHRAPTGHGHEGRGEPRGVLREGLLRNLSTVDPDVVLILVVAPLGYGKSTMAEQWSRTWPGNVAWLRIGSEHRDPNRLVADLASALLRSGPAGDVPGTVLAPSGDVPPVGAPARLAEAVRAIGRPVTVVLDDLHVLRTRASLDLTLGLALRMPRGSRIVALADRRPRLSVGRLRNEGRCLELGPDDLAFSRHEAAEFLDAADLRLGDGAVDRLVRRTDGWPVGLQLATLALRSRSDTSAAVAEFDGTNQYVVDYFRDEVLAGLNVETVRFLMRTAVLDRVCASLCDAVLATSGSAAWLEEVRALGLFVVPLDDHGEWFRYQGLFAEMLRGELRRREPGEDLRILRAASLWFMEHGVADEAIECAIAGEDGLSAARLIVANAQQLHSEGRMGLVREWLEDLDEDILERYPPAAIMAFWAWALTGEAALASRALRIAETSAFDGPMPDGSASLASAVARARAALMPDGVDGMLVDAERAVELEPPGSDWHTMASLLLGVAHMLRGERNEAAQALTQAALFGRAEQRPGASFALGLHSLMAADAGDWGTAAACARDARRLVDAANLWGNLTSLPAYAAAARVALHRGETQRALNETREALRIFDDPSPAALPWLAVLTAVVLGRLVHELGDGPKAEEMLVEARRHLAPLATQGVLTSDVDALAAVVATRTRRDEAADVAGMTKSELRVLRLLPTHHSLGEMGDDLGVSRNTVKSQVAAIYRKLEVGNRAEAVRRAQELGLLPS